MGKRLELKGQTFGWWKVLRYAGMKGKATTWLCRCVCGITRAVGGWRLTNGQSKSCGCQHTKQTLAARFWKHVNKHGPFPHTTAVLVHPDIKRTRCWLWTGAKTYPDGYGVIEDQINKVWHKLRAHRVAWFVATGKWPEKHALHKCDVPLCVRFSHLFDGSDADNLKDMKLKGRGSKEHAKL